MYRYTYIWLCKNKNPLHAILIFGGRGRSAGSLTIGFTSVFQHFAMESLVFSTFCYGEPCGDTKHNKIDGFDPPGGLGPTLGAAWPCRGRAVAVPGDGFNFGKTAGPGDCCPQR